MVVSRGGDKYESWGRASGTGALAERARRDIGVSGPEQGTSATPRTGSGVTAAYGIRNPRQSHQRAGGWRKVGAGEVAEPCARAERDLVKGAAPSGSTETLGTDGIGHFLS
jgi:hypothetical protein